MEWGQIIGAIAASLLGTTAFLKFSAEKIIEASVEKVLHKEQMLTEADLEFRQRQLEEFYGPIYASLKLSSQIYPMWMDGKITEINQDIIDLFRQQNAEIITILKTKAHLIEGDTIPPEFIRFMTSATIWSMYCQRKDQPFVPDSVAELEAVQWPAEFESHIFEKTETLKSQLDTLLRKYRAT